MRVVGEEADVLLELEALLLHEAERLPGSWLPPFRKRELVLVDDELDPLAQDEAVVRVGVHRSWNVHGLQRIGETNLTPVWD